VTKLSSAITELREAMGKPVVLQYAERITKALTLALRGRAIPHLSDEPGPGTDWFIWLELTDDDSKLKLDDLKRVISLTPPPASVVAEPKRTWQNEFFVRVAKA